MNKVLIIGLGFGNLYKEIYTELGYEITTVDFDKQRQPTFCDINDALTTAHYDIAHVCTPNATHGEIARKIANHCSIILIEKPGLVNAEAWSSLNNQFPNTRFAMVKNNQWRENRAELIKNYKSAKTVKLHWINCNRVPAPGSWFTTKELAFGGVSRDLLPHLLSMYILLESEWKTTEWTEKVISQHWQLSDLVNSDYGAVNVNGVYDVDDYTKFTTSIGDKNIEIVTDWKSNSIIDIALHFDNTRFDLGLCPIEAYKTMVLTALENKTNDIFWKNQLEQDLWIHKAIDL